MVPNISTVSDIVAKLCVAGLAQHGKLACLQVELAEIVSSLS